LKQGRTVHSLIKMLTQNNCKILTCPSFLYRHESVPPISLDLPSSYGSYPCVKIDEIENYLEDIDVLYMTRTQKERINEYDCSFFEFSKFFKLDNRTINKLKEKCVILHPLPRNEEISEEVDDDPRSAYHERQIKNGLYTRIALIQYLLQC
ncbi:MAG: aspartate carbamoyltransferase, partial [bacterium]